MSQGDVLHNCDHNASCSISTIFFSLSSVFCSVAWHLFFIYNFNSINIVIYTKVKMQMKSNAASIIELSFGVIDVKKGIWFIYKMINLSKWKRAYFLQTERYCSIYIKHFVNRAIMIIWMCVVINFMNMWDV